jgi:hypothetical protein
MPGNLVRKSIKDKVWSEIAQEGVNMSRNLPWHDRKERVKNN